MVFRSLIAIVTISLILGTRLPVARADQPAGVSWRTDMKQAATEVIEKRRPMLLLFTSANCSYCKLMKRTTYSDDTVASHVNRYFVPMSVDGSHDRWLAKQLGIRVYPTTIILSPNNEVVERMDGYVKPQEMSGRLAQVATTLDEAETESR